MGQRKNTDSIYHLTTVLICFGIVLAMSIALLISYMVRLNSGDKYQESYDTAKEYYDAYFSDRILNGVTVSGYDVGGMTRSEAVNYISGKMDYDIKTESLVLSFEGKEWSFDRSTLKLTIDVEKAVEKAYRTGRYGTDEERNAAYAVLDNGGKIDISATVIDDREPLVDALNAIKEQIDIETKDATVEFKIVNNEPVFTYTDERIGRRLDVAETIDEIEKQVMADEKVISYTLLPETVKPRLTRSAIEKEYKLCASYTTNLSAYSAEGRINNITRALEALDDRVWMPGETFSFNQWVGARTVENGYGLGVFINEQQQYDETVGGGICQVSTTMYYCSLLAGANSRGRHAPIEVIERQPHTWPSEYISRGLDATVSWPHADLKLYNNNVTPYFINTSIEKKGSKLYVTVQLYGSPLPNNASVIIETETIEEIPAGANEYIVDKDNKYGLQPGEQKVISAARTGYTVNVYQIWIEPGKEPIKSLITVSKYDPVNAKIYVGAG